MKALKYFLSLILFSVFATITLAGGETSYNIIFKIKGAIKDSNYYLANSFADKHYIQDTAKADANGQILFTGKEKLEEGLYVLILPKKKSFEFIVDKAQNFKLETDTTDFMKYMKVTGSDDNKVYYEYVSFLIDKQKEAGPLREQLQKVKNNKDSTKMLSDKMNKIDKDVKSYFQNFVKQHPKTLTAKMIATMLDPEIPAAPILSNGRPDSTFAWRYMRTHFWDNYDFSDERLLYTPILHSKMKQFIDNMTYPFPDSVAAALDIIIEKSRANKEVFRYVVASQTFTYESSNLMGMDAVFVHLVEKYYMTKQAFWVDSTQLVKINEHAIALKPLLIGKYAPNLTLKDSSMRDVTLYDMTSPYTIIYFWDYNCSHCKKVTPLLLEWWHKTKFKAIKVFAVSTETDAVPWKKYVIENKLDWINVYDPYSQSGFRSKYNISSTPIMIIMDENKKIVANRRLESDQLDGFFEHLINQKAIDKTNPK